MKLFHRFREWIEKLPYNHPYFPLAISIIALIASFLK